MSWMDAVGVDEIQSAEGGGRRKEGAGGRPCRPLGGVATMLGATERRNGDDT